MRIKAGAANSLWASFLKMTVDNNGRSSCLSSESCKEKRLTTKIYCDVCSCYDGCDDRFGLSKGIGSWISKMTGRNATVTVNKISEKSNFLLHAETRRVHDSTVPILP